MEQHITIARPADAVFAYLADPAHIFAWLPQLRRVESELPRSGLNADAARSTIAWEFEPAGEWHVQGVEDVTRLTLRLHRDVAPPADPTEHETLREAARFSALAALHSLKSHLEGVGGGDPDLPVHNARAGLFGHTATRDPEI